MTHIFEKSQELSAWFRCLSVVLLALSMKMSTVIVRQYLIARTLCPNTASQAITLIDILCF